MLKDKITEYWHISRTALADRDISRHSRMLYIKETLLKYDAELVTGMTNKAIWFEIEDGIRVF